MANSRIAIWKGFPPNVIASRLASFLLLCSFFWMTAASSFSGFVGSWALRDSEKQVYGIESMLDRTANKPWVYRQFAPVLANLADIYTPAAVKNEANWRGYEWSLSPDKTFARATAAAKPELHFRYMFVYYVSFLSLFLSLFVLRQIALQVRAGRLVSSVAPAIFILAFPYLMTFGGYFYDNIELLFMSLAFLLAVRGNIALLTAVTFPATLNKETFIFFLPALYPLLRCNLSKKMSSIAVAIAIAASGLVNVLAKVYFLHSPGGMAEFHLRENIRNYLIFSNYFLLAATHGIIGPAGAFAGTLLVMGIILLRGWPACPLYVRRHLLIAAVINFPLYLIFCRTGELRDLSLMFVGFMILIACALEHKEGDRTVDRHSLLPLLLTPQPMPEE